MINLRKGVKLKMYVKPRMSQYAKLVDEAL